MSPFWNGKNCVGTVEKEDGRDIFNGHERNGIIRTSPLKIQNERENGMRLSIRPVSSLEKVFLDEELRAAALHRGSAARGEVYSFQVAVRSERVDGVVTGCGLEVAASGELPVEVREVVSVPNRVPLLQDDPYMLRDRPGLYPDALRPLRDRFWRLPGDQWRALWVTVRVPEDCRPGMYDVKITLSDAGMDQQTMGSGKDAVETVFQLEVLPFVLPEQTLLRYEWFHVDCLATCYNVPCWSEKHWEIIENFVRCGAAHGLNVLLTPLWTPPLDTAIGRERPTTQLLRITRNGNRYTFDFSLLERYIELGKRCGITHFAMSHAFTQWGAKATPKIVAVVDGVEKRIFGWDVASDDPSYADFLRQLMPELLAFFRKRGLEKNIFFSVSDEPSEENIESYSKASALLNSLIEGAPTVEALSSFEFYKRGLVRRPVPANNHIEPFVGQVSELWTYYCVGQEKLVPNRFCAMPSARNRIMGVMFYCYDIVGFLQWGFNFYYSQYSLYPVDPWNETNAGNWVPAGDPFIVYPGPDGVPYDSLRHEVFFEAIQDLRALRALERKIGREAVLALLHEGLDYRLSMTDYPRSADWLLGVRERINRALAE